MSQTLEEIAKGLADSDKKVQLIYGFNGNKANRPINKKRNMTNYNTIAETPNFIVLDSYERSCVVNEDYQSEDALEREFIRDLKNQGYLYASDIRTPAAMLANVRVQLQELNNVEFTDDEWKRFEEQYLDPASENSTDKARKLHEDYIYDFTFDDGHTENIYLIDKKNVCRNKMQVIKQFEQKGSHANRYDVTILVNGLPMVQVELKKRGVAIREAFNQVHRYSKESFNSDHSLYKYLQLFVISNGTDSRYFANTVKRNKNSFDFTMNWARLNSKPIKDLKDFTATFFQKRILLKVLLEYSVFDSNDTLLVMRPYQIAATERILWKIKSAFQAKNWSKTESGGYIWHTTGSGKTLTSFKAARLATELDFVDKVLFVVDRKDLDYQTMKEYQRFSQDSVNGSGNTAGLKRNMEKDDNKIIVTTIQKLNNLMKGNDDLPIYNKQVVFIFDECHRSQFGEAQKNLKKKFKRYYQFGFTGTPIFPENAPSFAETTENVFGCELHSYVITDAIRDEKVLKFKVDYNDVRPQFKSIETEQDEKKLTTAEYKQALLHLDRIREIAGYVLDNFSQKTHRAHMGAKGFNAMFAVSSVDAAKAYYEAFSKLQAGEEDNKRLTIATIFSFVDNEEQDAVGDIPDESFEVSAMESSAKEFLSAAIDDYNTAFKTNFAVDSQGFQNYYRDLAQRVKKQEVDLLIVVGMFLTGFDAPSLNTLFIDKNLRNHGLLQAYSRTNRIYNATKTCGNIVTFRDLEQSTIDALKLFGDKKKKDVENIVLEKSFKEHIKIFTDRVTALRERFSEPSGIEKEQDKKEFVELFGEYLRVENTLRNYDEFTALNALQKVDLEDTEAVEEFKAKHYLDDDAIEELRKIDVLSDRLVQDYRSTYNDIGDWLRLQKEGDQKEQSTVDWDGVVFEVELQKSQEINLDYILELIFEHNKKTKNKDDLIDEAQRLILASVSSRAKEDLIVDFIKQTNLDDIGDTANMIATFFEFAQKEQKREARELIETEGLNEEEARYYIQVSLKRKHATENGLALKNALPKMSPLNPQYQTKKQTVLRKISAFVEKFKGVGGSI